MLGLERLVAAEPVHIGPKLICFAAAVAIPCAIRAALEPMMHGSIYYTAFYPGTLFVTLVLGRSAGALHIVVTTLLGPFLFAPPRLDLALSSQELVGMFLYVFSAGLIVLTASALRTAIRGLEAAHDRELILNAELRHRVNNSLAVVQGLAFRASRNNGDPQAYKALEHRLYALSRANEVLIKGDWEACELPELADAALAPFNRPGLTIAGPACRLPAESCVPLVLALHELATNAVKYGAFSVPDGRVDLRWEERKGDDAPYIVMHWEESGGPVVKPPTRRGLGSRLIASQRGLGSVEVSYLPQGLSCRIETPILPRTPKQGARKTRTKSPSTSASPDSDIFTQGPARGV